MNSSLEPGSVLCLYHDDADGRCAAAIVRRALGKEVQLKPMDYQTPIPWDLIESAQRVVIVDFSLSLANMRRAGESRDLIWIDHHKSALDALAELADLPGLRSLDEAGCVLTWQYYFPDSPLPIAVLLIGDRDIWRFAHEDTAAFGAGIFQRNNQPENSRLWDLLFDDDPVMLAEIIEHGALLHQADLGRIRSRVKRDGFEVLFEGHRTLALNDRGSGHTGELIRKQGYSIAYCYTDRAFDGKIHTTVTLYSGNVDVSLIAQKFGGGGHPGASGFSFKRNGAPFPDGAIVEFLRQPSE